NTMTPYARLLPGLTRKSVQPAVSQLSAVAGGWWRCQTRSRFSGGMTSGRLMATSSGMAGRAGGARGREAAGRAAVAGAQMVDARRLRGDGDVEEMRV